jgi:RHS repeat-associated protein
MKHLVRWVAGSVCAFAIFGCGREQKSEVTAQATEKVTSGPCSFSPPPTGGTVTNVTFTVKTPSGVLPASLALGTDLGALTVENGVHTVVDSGGFASVASVEATGRLIVGTDVQAQSAYSELTGINLGDRTHLRGVVKTANTLIRGANVVIDGSISQNTSLKPLGVLSWNVAFPSLNRGSCDIQPDNTETIDPGTYGAISVKGRSHLKLRAGTYYFSSLSLEATAFLDVDNAAGPVFVNVKNAFAWSGTVVETQPTKGNVVFALATTSAVNILTAIRGLIVAPSATLTLASDGSSGHFGSFFAKSLDAQANATFHQRPLSSAAVCPGATDCSALCPCGGGGLCQSDSECQVGFTCQTPSGGGPKVCTPVNIDDGNPCTADSIVNGNVVHTPLPAGTSCSDGNACNGAETCNGSGVCLAGTPPTLDDGNPCTTDACNPTSGVTHTPVAAGTSCSDGNVCNGSETCNATAVCVAGTAPPIDDNNPCTTDTCDPSTGVSHTPVAAGTSCSDNNACNGAETCNASATCVAGTPPIIDDGNPCTADACDPSSGVTHTPVAAGTSCSDGNACNGAETCNATGTCTPGMPVVCVASDQCHDVGTCSASTGVCTNPAKPNGSACSDGNACTQTDTCQAGTCASGSPVPIDDNNPCTTDACNPSTGVSHTPVAAGTSCSDGNACNGAETCNASATCVAGTPPVIDDNNPCTTDACNPSTGVSHTPVAAGTSCSDGNACNGAETCNASAACVAGTPPVIDDNNPCTTDACDPSTGVSHTPVAAGTSCSDGNACNGVETCNASGTCTPGTAVTCVALDQCHQVGTCDPGTGACSNPSKPDGTTCDDSSACTQADTCHAGSCVGSNPVTCAASDACHDAGTCDPTSGQCSNPTKPDGASCADANVCNGSETCHAGACTAGTPPPLDDGNSCTDDTCDPITGVAHTPRAAGSSCSDLDLCNGNETCDGSGACQPGTPVHIDTSNACNVGTCDPATGVVTYNPAPEGTTCDVDLCTTGSCNGAGECTPSAGVTQDDGDPCTIEWCDPVLGPQQKRCTDVDRTVNTTLYSSMKWLLDPPNPVQVGVAPGTIVVQRAVALRGLVTRRDGTALSGVNVAIMNHPEFGHTMSQANGYFDMLVNGGTSYTLDFQKDGYLRSQRTVTTMWQEYLTVPDVMMLQPDPVVTSVDLTDVSQDFHVAQGSVQTDQDGTRQGTVLVPSGTQAVMHLADGTTVNLNSMNVRITEFTVGPDGDKAMPRSLPPESKYTHAFEVNADEAVAAGATSITFSTPLVYYVDNFTHFPAGTKVPLGSLNRDGCGWVAEETGVVLNILDTSGGQAKIDVTGDGVADTGSTLTQYGITTAELQKLASLYTPGRTLWRTRLPHFTRPWDENWGGGPPPDASPPPPDPPHNDPPPKNPCDQGGGSTIECEMQALRESVPIAGTPYSLNYSSARAPGRLVANQITIPLSGATIPASLLRIGVDVTIAGVSRHFDYPAQANQTATFTWDGLDSFGRRLQGTQIADINLSYVYQYTYERTDRFGYNGNGLTITVSESAVPPPPGQFPTVCSGGGCVQAPAQTRQEISLARRFTSPVGAFDATGLGLGGWTLDVQHVHQLVPKRLELGDGHREDATTIPPVVTSITTGIQGGNIQRIGPDASIYTHNPEQVFKRTPDGNTVVFAGSQDFGYGGEGVPATDPSVKFNGITDVALCFDGSTYISDLFNAIVRRVGPDGIIRTVAGIPKVVDTSGSEGPATSTPIANPQGLAVGPDCSVYFATNSAIMRLAPDGNLNRIAGIGGRGNAQPIPPDGTPARSVDIEPRWLALAPNGDVYALLDGCNQANTICSPQAHLVRISDGLMYLVAGKNFCANSSCPVWLDGDVAANAGITVQYGFDIDAHGKIFAADQGGNTGRERVFTISPDGRLWTESGTLGTGAQPVVGVPATNALIGGNFSLGPDGSMYFGPNNGTILRVASALPGDTGASSIIGSRDGERFYSFDVSGKHLNTKHALTGANLVSFGYDSAGRVTTITNEAGKVTTVQRDSAGKPLAIVAPFGQQTTLGVGSDGYLSTITDPEGGQVAMTYDDGLLKTFTNARGVTSNITYDSVGRLQIDADAAGGSHTLARTETSSNWTVQRSTALGRTTTYATQVQPGGRQTKTVTNPDGTTATVTAGPDQITHTAYPDGSIVTTTQLPDTRLGLNSPVTSRTTALPSGLTSTETDAVSYSFLDPTNILNFNDRTTTRNINGKTWQNRYTNSTRTYVSTTPANRTSTRVIDTLGRTTSTQIDGLAAVNFFYDTSGRLDHTTRGGGALTRTTTYGYVPTGTSTGYLQSITDPLTDATSYAPDGLGRSRTESRAGATTTFTWDPESNLSSVTPPGKPTHGMTYTPVNLLATYDPPLAGLSNASTTYTYDADRMLRTETRPDGLQIVRTPDTFGRQGTVQILGGMLQYNYYPSGTPTGAGKTSDILGPYGVNLHFTYDGALTKAMSWSGDVSGNLTWSYNGDFNRILETVSGSSGSAQAAFGYDSDQLLTCASPTTCSPPSSDSLQLTRNGAGVVASIALGSTSETLTYNTFGELARQTVTFASSMPLVDITYDAAGVERDKLGRIAQKTEVIGGVTNVYRYTYDHLLRLTDVKLNGTLAEHFEYDANGNRTLGFNAAAGTTYAATYDDQDRLLSYGPFDFTYTANGELETKTNRETGESWLFQYDALGNLLSVGLPDGDLVDYLVDGMGRRVGKKKNGVLLKEWIYRDSLKPVAELDGSGALVAEFVYGSKVNVPDYVRRAGNTYRVISDQLGSPRYVVNVTNASDVPFTANYTSFGAATGTGLDWMPFGFAGGHFDSDTRLVRFGHRDYDPAPGRWLTKDPLKFAGALNFFRYAEDDPINAVDLDGASPADACILSPYLCSGFDWFKTHKPSDFWHWLFGNNNIGPTDPTPGMCGNPPGDWSCTFDGLNQSNSPMAPLCEYTCHNSSTNELRNVQRYAVSRRSGPRSTDMGWVCMDPENVAGLLD